MHTHADEIFGPRIGIQLDECLGVEAFRLPQRERVFVAESGRMPIGFVVVLILGSSFDVHVACVPVSLFNG